MPKTRLALVGAGVIGKRHLKAIGEVAEAELVAISDSNAEAERLARDNEVPFFSSTEEMLSTHRGWMHEIAPEPIAVEFEAAYVAQCRHFCAVINGTEQPRITALNAAKTLRATLDVFEAADKGTEIRLCNS